MEKEKSKRKSDTSENDANTQKGRLAEENINYFKRVEQVLLENSFHDGEHKETFLKNVFNQIEKDGNQLTRHPLTSKVLEKIIPLLDAAQYKKLLLLFEPDVELISCDRFASHVMETMCKNVKLHVNNAEVSLAFSSICKAMRKSIGEFLRNAYGSHVLSSILQALSGVEVSELVTKSRSSRESKKRQKSFAPDTSSMAVQVTDSLKVISVPDVFKKSFKKLAKVIESDDNFGELLCHRTGSPVLQVLLHVSSKLNKKKLNLLSKLIISRARIISIEKMEVEEEDEETVHKLPVVLTDEVGSHLLEAIIQTADEDIFAELANKCFKGFMISLCIHPVANYLAQTFLRSLKSCKQAEFFVTKMMKFMEDILASGHMGCIVRLAETIARLEIIEKQKTFLKTLMNALHIPNEGVVVNPIVKLILSMITYEVFFKVSEKEGDGEKDSFNNTELREAKLTKGLINYHGACLLKSCLLFKKSKLLVDSFLSLTTDELVDIACHPNGSFAFESFYQSQHIPAKKKKKLTLLLLGSIYVIACDKFGSRVIDTIWKEVDSDLQDNLRNSLREYKTKLESDLYGRIILYNCGVKQQVAKTRDIKEKQEKKRKYFEDILENKEEKELPLPKKMKKKVKNDDRASKYREQLKLLGITFENENEDNKETKVIVNSKDTQDDLKDVLEAIEATTKQKWKKKKSM